MSSKNKKLVCMLKRAVDMTYNHKHASMSGLEPDKSELRARKLLKRLNLLAEKDPNNSFGKVFSTLQLELLKHLRRTKH